MDSPNLAVALIAALALGFRHALDPDHLMAVSTLVAGTRERKGRVAARLGTIWGAGHALAIVVLGLPIVLAHAVLPDVVQRVAETAIGVIIVLLAARLLLRWRRGAYHAHVHEHEGSRHVHVHAHRETSAHTHEHPRPRTPLQAFMIGVTHGIGGSAAVGLLLLAALPNRGWATAALVLFAVGTAVSMGAVSGALGWLLGRDAVERRFRYAVLGLGLTALAFGVVYAVGAWVPAFGIV
jgi:ABC-type nickel/cobalt efflux system permease component RcnA